MSRVVVAWKPLSAKASAAASISRPAASAPAGRPAALRVPVVLVMVDSMPHGAETKQALSHRRRAMPRNVYGPDHEAFRETAREFVDRSLQPRAEDFIEDKAIGARRLARGRQAGPARPRGARGVRRVRGRRLPVQRRARRGALEVHRRGVLLLRHPRRLRRAVPRRPGHRGAEAALAARVLLRRAGHRDRDDRALRRVRPGRAEDDRGARRRRLGPQRLQDLHHQRLLGRPRRGGRPHRPAKGAKGITLFGVETGMAGLRARPQAGQGRPDESDTAELFFDDVRVPDANVHRRGRPRLHRT